MSFERRMEEEYIPPAPAFCQRITPEEAEIQAEKSTKIGLENLYNDVINKIDANRRKKEFEKEAATYSKIMKQSKLLEQIEAFFECDEERQKAKFMNMLIDNNRNAARMTNMESKIIDLEKIVNELRDSEEHLNNVMEGYEEGEREFKLKIAEQRTLIKEKDDEILGCKTRIEMYRNNLRKVKMFYRFVIFIQMVIIAYIITKHI